MKKNISDVYKFLNESIEEFNNNSEKDLIAKSDEYTRTYSNFIKSVQTLLDFWVSDADDVIEDYCQARTNPKKYKSYYNGSDVINSTIEKYEVQKGIRIKDFVFLMPSGEKVEFLDDIKMKNAINDMLIDMSKNSKSISENIKLLGKDDSSYDIFFRYAPDRTVMYNAIDGWEWCYGGDF